MNKPTEQNSAVGIAKRINSVRYSPYRYVPSFIKIEPLINSDPNGTAQEAVCQAMPRDAAKDPEAPETAMDAKKNSADSPMLAAMGNDDVMSQPQQQSMPSVDEIKGNWRQQFGTAKIALGKLTDWELLKFEGPEQ